MSISVGSAAWKLAFQLSPIILVGGQGLANAVGGYLPIMAITEAINFPAGILSGGDFSNLDNFFANFEPLPGSTLIDQELGRYPFANQAVAANAIIAQPTMISMKMTCPARGNFGYYTKLAIMTALVAALQNHNQSGGYYHIATPSQIYFNVVMKRMTDISTGETKQPQNTWQLDFEKPLLTLEAAQGALNSLFNKISSFTPITGQSLWSTVPLAASQTVSGAAIPIQPAITSAAAASPIITVAPLAPLPGTVASPFGGSVGSTIGGAIGGAIP